MVAHVLVSKYADHLPLYRQAQILSRQDVDLDRSTLADWDVRAAFELRPVYDALMADLKRSTKLFMDETRAPVLDPGRRKTKTGYFWALAQDDRPWNGTAPPGLPSPTPRDEVVYMPNGYCRALAASCRWMCVDAPENASEILLRYRHVVGF